MWGNWKPHTLVGIWNDAAAVENSLAVPQKAKHRITVWPSSSIPGYIPKRTSENRCSRLVHEFIAAVCTLVKNLNNSKMSE
jgi:hypothetical protein